jgi:hypothetical protein
VASVGCIAEEHAGSVFRDEVSKVSEAGLASGDSKQGNVTDNGPGKSH